MATIEFLCMRVQIVNSWRSRLSEDYELRVLQLCSQIRKCLEIIENEAGGRMMAVRTAWHPILFNIIVRVEGRSDYLYLSLSIFIFVYLYLSLSILFLSLSIFLGFPRVVILFGGPEACVKTADGWGEPFLPLFPFFVRMAVAGAWHFSGGTLATHSTHLNPLSLWRFLCQQQLTREERFLQNIRAVPSRWRIWKLHLNWFNCDR